MQMIVISLTLSTYSDLLHLNSRPEGQRPKWGVGREGRCRRNLSAAAYMWAVPWPVQPVFIFMGVKASSAQPQGKESCTYLSTNNNNNNINTSGAETSIPAKYSKLGLKTEYPVCGFLIPSKQILRYCHDLVTRHGVWIGNWIYWTRINRNYKNYSALANSRSRLPTTAHTKPSMSSLAVAW
jgi:hypothetical protein